MKKVFLDANVIIDSVDPTRDNISANAILSACDFQDIEGCVSFLSVANSAYILRKGRTAKELRTVLKELFDGITVLPMDSSQLKAAYDVEAPDFEDVLQYECAKSAKCEIIVTSNTKHFKFCKDIEVVTTAEYARLFMEENS